MARAGSGTEEEFDRAMARRARGDDVEVMVYFKTADLKARFSTVPDLGGSWDFDGLDPVPEYVGGATLTFPEIPFAIENQDLYVAVQALQQFLGLVGKAVLLVRS